MSGMESLSSMSLLGDSPLQVSINGQPLSLVVSTLIKTIQELSQQVQTLQQYTYNTDSEMWTRIGALENSVANLEADSGITSQRPLVGVRSGLQPSLLAFVTNVEARTAAMESRHKMHQSDDLQNMTEKMIAKRYMETWVKFNRLQSVMHALSGDSTARQLRRFYQKLKRFVEVKKQHVKRDRGIRTLQYNTIKTMVKSYWEKWRGFHDLIEERYVQRRGIQYEQTAQMSTISLRGICRRFFLKWFRFAEFNAKRNEQFETIIAMEQISSRQLVTRYMRYWQIIEDSHAYRRRQRKVSQALALHSYDNLKKRFLGKWLRLVVRRRKRNLAATLVPRMHHFHVEKLAGKYFTKWSRFLQYQTRNRDKDEIDTMFAELSRRCDTLGTQVDVGLRTMANTTTVLNQVVDRVVVMDDKLKYVQILEGAAQLVANAPEDGGMEMGNK